MMCAAAEYGKAIFCEKPISLEVAETERALAAVARAGVPLQIGFNRRFDPGYRKAREAYASGALGRLYMIKSTLRDPHLPSHEYLARSGGIFRDAVIHDIDALRYLSGEEIVEVYAMGAALVDPVVAELGDADTVSLSVRFAGGALGIVDASRHAVYGQDVKTEVFGSWGAMVVEKVRDVPVTRYDASGVWHDHIYWFLERFDAAYLAELQAFVDCVRAGATPEVTGEDGRRALLVALAATRSWQTNRPITVAYD
jgi:myo-inositol 2-dehydrogenase/D-chiro-inositol 1-dehydrogenase